MSNINKSTSGGKYILFYNWSLITQKTQGKNTRPDNGGSSWCGGHGGVLITGLCLMAFSALYRIKARDSSAGVAPPTVTCTFISGIK